MTDGWAYKFEQQQGIMPIDSDISGQTYLIDDERKGIVVRLGNILIRTGKCGTVIGLTKEQAIQFANELLGLVEMFFEE